MEVIVIIQFVFNNNDVGMLMNAQHGGDEVPLIPAPGSTI